MLRSLIVTTIVVLFSAFSGVADAQIPTCEAIAFTPCGGDMTGTWQYGEIVCSEGLDIVSSMFPDCTTGSTEVDGSIVGTTTFNPDGTYEESQTRNLSLTAMIPIDCLPEGVACDMLEDEAGTLTITDSHCIVVFSIEEIEAEAGTYTVTGASATLTEPDGDIDQGNFCISGDVMTVEVVDPENPQLRVIITHTRVN